MKFSTAINTVVCLGASLVAAIPCGSAPPQTTPTKGSGDQIVLDATKLLAIAPNSSDCSGFDNECRTNSQVAPLLWEKTKDLGLGVTAAIVSLTAFETGDYKYKRNKFPGRPGQGTSNMQMFEFNLPYAQSIPELKPKLDAIGTDYTNNDTKNAILDLVVDDKYNFGSGAWFIKTKCDPKILDELNSPTARDQGWADYLGCIHTPMSDERTVYWTRAKQAFGL